jgi:hypothetical protein
MPAERARNAIKEAKCFGLSDEIESVDEGKKDLRALSRVKSITAKPSKPFVGTQHEKLILFDNLMDL